MLATNIEKLLKALYDQKLEFVIIGGAAAVLHGSVPSLPMQSSVTRSRITITSTFPSDLMLLPELEALLEIRKSDRNR